MDIYGYINKCESIAFFFFDRLIYFTALIFMLYNYILYTLSSC